MIKLVGGAVIGLLVSLIGIYIASIYVMTRQEGGSPILVGVGVVIIAGGIYSIVKGFLTFRTEKALVQNIDLEIEGTPSNDGGAIIKKNNDMLKDWNKTNNARDKLKMLEAAGAAEEGR